MSETPTRISLNRMLFTDIWEEIKNMSLKFTVKIFKVEKFYIARVPELGVTTQGKTRAEAKKNLRDALQLHLEAMAEYAIEHGNVRIENAQLVSANR